MKCFPYFGSFRWRAIALSPPPPPPPPVAVEADRSGPSRPPMARRSKSATDRRWRPMLSVISEDAVAPADEMRTDRLMKKSASARQPVAVRSKSFRRAEECNDRPSSVSMVTPIFYATPFMF